MSKKFKLKHKSSVSTNSNDRLKCSCGKLCDSIKDLIVHIKEENAKLLL